MLREQQQKDKIKIYNQYGFNPPLKGKYKRNENVLYSVGDFRDGEEIYFFWNCEKPSACALGNAYYINGSGISNLINIADIE